MGSLSPLIEANATALVLGTLLGVNPQVTPTAAGGYTVQYSPNDVPAASEKLNQLILSWRRGSKAKPDGVVYNLENIVTPVIWKQYWWVLVVGAFAGAGVYWLGTKKGRKNA